MILESLHLTQFRNYSSLVRSWSPGVNAIAAPNGAGKTNLLEAIHLLCFTRGFHPDKASVQLGEDFFMVKGQWRDAQGENTLDVACNYHRSKGKTLLVGGDKQARMSNHIGRIPVVALLPNDTDFVRGPAAERRKWLDSLLAQTDQYYIQYLLRYNQCLKQRSAALYQASLAPSQAQALLAPWNEQLREYGEKIIRLRQAWCEVFVPEYQEGYAWLANTNDSFTITYKPNIKENSPAGWARQLAEKYEQELRLTRNLVGPHRDDLVLSKFRTKLQAVGSQGEQKTAMTALKLAQSFYTCKRNGKTPVLLLDDVFDKLDRSRVRRLAEYLVGGQYQQVFLTDTSLERLKDVFADAPPGAVSFYTVQNNEVQQEG